MPSAVRAGGTGARVRFRTALGPLLLYHVLILSGGALAIVAVVRGPTVLLVPGLVLLAAGIITVLWVLGWAGRLAGRAAAASPSREAPLPMARWICVRCGNAGTGQPVVCPRCGGWLTRAGAGDPEIRRTGE